MNLYDRKPYNSLTSKKSSVKKAVWGSNYKGLYFSTTLHCTYVHGSQPPMLPLNTFSFILGTFLLLKHWLLDGNWRAEGGREGGFSRRGISIVSRKLLKYVHVCVFSEHFSHICKPLIPTSDFFLLHFLPSRLIANVNRWDPLECGEWD